MKKTLKYTLFGILTLILFFIFRPIFYAVCFYFVTFFIYLYFNKKLNKKIVFLDSALIHSFIVIPLTMLAGWFCLPILIDYSFKQYLEYSNFIFWNNLVNFFSSFILNFPSHFLLIILSIIILMFIFKIMNIINSAKLKKYTWLIFIVIFSPIGIIYYFLIGRKSIINNSR